MNNDYFLVVQTIESNKPVITVVPNKWVSGDMLSWPSKQANELRKNAASMPASSWSKMPCTVKRKYIPTFIEAELEAGELSGQSTDASDYAPKRKKKLKNDSNNTGLDLNHLVTGARTGERIYSTTETETGEGSKEPDQTVLFNSEEDGQDSEASSKHEDEGENSRDDYEDNF